MPRRIQNSESRIPNSKGLFVSFEGIEGCGKSTQAGMLARWLKSRGFKVLLTREPGGPGISEQIRKLLLDCRNHHMDPMTELLLLQAARAQHVAQVIKPALEKGVIVLCDRFADSSTAYQGYGRGLSLEMVNTLNRIAVGGVWPRLTLVFDLPVEAGLQRASKRRRALDRMESQQRAFHQRVRRGFREIVKHEPERVKLLDGGQAPDVVQAAVRQLVWSRLK
jgi:dTMP kinase